ncbi:hypothetical protein K469DRAFT_686002 [Zopfia rhizophila CBS 207.26]|uniref:Uncharacterized protein n=1 Tax=Zopfia rhizophila CBS 207.26 TaxID=1314779 RepID=A0A6A6D8U2_9PEZI|nr:hypothetical protein K469DRAFT_686002 [Zopfia rhizophila CBS 207.26]
METIATRNGISERTGRNWMAERRQYGSPIAVHRMRKLKAEDRGHKLGRPLKIPQKTLDEMCKSTNPMRWKPLKIQRRYWEISTSVRTLQRSLKRRKKRAGMYVASRRKHIKKANKAERVIYGENNWEKPLFGYWDQVYFTDEAHYNVTGYYQVPRVLREEGEQWALHMHSWVNYYEKGPLDFYSEEDPENNLLPTPKAPGKPRKKKKESNEAYAYRLIKWENNQPPEVELQITGAHMTQKYYTIKLLPTYIKALHNARVRDESKSYYLQEDGDPSHGIKTTYNTAYRTKDEN